MEMSAKLSGPTVIVVVCSMCSLTKALNTPVLLIVEVDEATSTKCVLSTLRYLGALDEFVGVMIHMMSVTMHANSLS